MGYNLHRYSSLKQIDRSNVKRLVPIWNLSLDNPWGEQAQPLIYDGVMYVTDAKSTVAITSGPAGRYGRRRSIGRLRSTASSAAGSQTKVRPSTTANCSAPRSTSSLLRLIARLARRSGDKRLPSGKKATR
jgi:hypothetical protein